MLLRIPKIDVLTFCHKSKKALVALSFCFLSAGCVTTVPSIDYVLARQAFSAAKAVDAARYSPSNYHKAEEAYRRGMNRYRARDYEKAMGYFRRAKRYAERAENAARIQRHRSGEEAL